MSKLILIVICLMWVTRGVFSEKVVGGGQPDTITLTSFLGVSCVQCEQEHRIIPVEESDVIGHAKLTMMAENFTEDLWNNCLQLNMRHNTPFPNLVPPEIFCVTETASLKLEIKGMEETHFFAKGKTTTEKLSGLFYGTTEAEVTSTLRKMNLGDGNCQTRHLTGIYIQTMIDQCDRYNNGQEILDSISIITLKFINCTICNWTRIVDKGNPQKEIRVKEDANREKGIGVKSSRMKIVAKKAAGTQSPKEKVARVKIEGDTTTEDKAVKTLHGTRQTKEELEILQIVVEGFVLSVMIPIFAQ